MAFSTGGNGWGGRARSRRLSSMSEINVVPLVDIMLVLLVIFMITAHVMEFGLEVDVPRVRQTKDSAKDLPVVTITKNGELYLNENPVNIHVLAQEIRQRFAGIHEVYVRADKDTIWDVIAQVISELGEAKLAVNMVTQPVDEAERPRQR
ncbi:MAG: biopolymer transporter ExbD [Bryobacterales bacterium]|nr:biopolymer transporter ExbD [Bryobacteraceae bacterium]MDW8130660.1 biopolymer transporter ExbD [Bryobacterales bacterium]